MSTVDQKVNDFNTQLARYRLLASNLEPGDSELKDALVAKQVVALLPFKAAGVKYEPGQPVNDLPLPALMTLAKPVPGEPAGRVTTHPRYQAAQAYRALNTFRKNRLEKVQNALSHTRHREGQAAAQVASLEQQLAQAREVYDQCQAAREVAEQAVLDALAEAPTPAAPKN